MRCSNGCPGPVHKFSCEFAGVRFDARCVSCGLDVVAHFDVIRRSQTKHAFIPEEKS